MPQPHACSRARRFRLHPTWLHSCASSSKRRCPGRAIASRAIRSAPKRSGAAAISIRRPIRSCGSKPAACAGRSTVITRTAARTIPSSSRCRSEVCPRTSPGASRWRRSRRRAIWSRRPSARAGGWSRSPARRSPLSRRSAWSTWSYAGRQGRGPRRRARSICRRLHPERGGPAAPGRCRIGCAAPELRDAAGDHRSRPHRRRCHDALRCRRAAAEAAERAARFDEVRVHIIWSRRRLRKPRRAGIRSTIACPRPSMPRTPRRRS